MRVRQPEIVDAWSADVARALRYFVRDVSAVLNGGTRLDDQFSTVKRGVRWNSDTQPTLGPFPRPISTVLLLSAALPTTPSVRTTGAPVTWTMRGDSVVILSIGGLASSTDYDVDLLCLEA